MLLVGKDCATGDVSIIVAEIWDAGRPRLGITVTLRGRLTIRVRGDLLCWSLSYRQAPRWRQLCDDLGGSHDQPPIWERAVDSTAANSRALSTCSSFPCHTLITFTFTKHELPLESLTCFQQKLNWNSASASTHKTVTSLSHETSLSHS